MQTCPCNIDSFIPHFCIVNWGLQGYTTFSYFSLKQRGGSNMYPQSKFGQKLEKYEKC